MNLTAWIFTLVVALWVPIITIGTVRIRRDRRRSP